MSLSELHGFIGQSVEIEKVFETIEKVARSSSTILIRGETGTGKGMAANVIHLNSDRADRPFVSVNCGAIPENLLESELFGHVKGAFTGAISSKIGKFERAEKGSIFLDEIGDMSPELQVKLLRILEEGEFERVGGDTIMKVDVRVIAATHQDLESRVKQGLFREDLFYRLYVIPLTMPPLRNRRTDIPLLAEYFLTRLNQKNHFNVEGFSKDALDIMLAYDWPGNVRELKNLVERLVVLKQNGRIEPIDLPGSMRDSPKPQMDFTMLELLEEGVPLNTAVTEFEKALILQSLEKVNWVKNRAAKLLHLNRTTLVEKIKRHNITPSDIAMSS
jgi:transcriptional regulator with GAF, ATPase, and Fis domain